VFVQFWAAPVLFYYSLYCKRQGLGMSLFYVSRFLFLHLIELVELITRVPGYKAENGGFLVFWAPKNENSAFCKSSAQKYFLRTNFEKKYTRVSVTFYIIWSLLKNNNLKKIIITFSKKTSARGANAARREW
jgi:hypothetical protein